MASLIPSDHVDGETTSCTADNVEPDALLAASTTPSSAAVAVIPVVIKWMGKEFPIEDVSKYKSVLDLKLKIQELTGVNAARQKLLNLSHLGKPAQDSTSLESLKLKSGFKIMMMGSLEKDIAAVDIPPEDLPDVVNDLDFSSTDTIELIESNDIYLSKIERRIEEYKIEMLNPLRDGKKLLVLDIDYTLFDHRSPAESGIELMRPGLHEFLRDAYQHYDIVIWSATSMKWIKEKMKLLNVTNHVDYKIAFYMDHLAMITVHTQKYGVVNVKALGVIWGKFPQYSNKNTIMFDDIRRNFLMNPQNGLRIRAFKHAHRNRETDRELFRLSVYLKKISGLNDISDLDHQDWEHYIKTHPQK